MTWDILCSLVFLCAALHGGAAIRFIAKPQQFIVSSLGLNVDFNCTSDDTQGTVKLFHRAHPTAPLKERDVSPGKLIKTDQVFTLVDAGTRDAGYYKCEATNRLGNETIQWPDNTGLLFLVSNVLPPLRVEPSDAQILLTGQSIELNCYSEGIKTTKLTWFKISRSSNNPPVKMLKHHVKVYKTPATNELKSVLTIKNAKREDSAGYKCRLSHNGQTRSKYATVTVRDPEVPTIEPYRGATDVKVPSEINLPCIAKAFPAPQVTWYKDGEPINVTDCAGYFGRKVCKNNVYVITETSNKIYVDNNLEIKQTQYPRDHGTYTCKAKSEYGTASLTIRLNVQVAPKLIKEKHFLAKHGIATNVSCEVNTSNPLPEFEWFYQDVSPDCQVMQNCKPGHGKWLPLPTQNQTIYPASGQTQKSIVRLPEDQAATFYLCRAKNNLGNDSHVFSFRRTEVKELGCFLQGNPRAFPEKLKDFKGTYKPIQAPEMIKACTKLTRVKGYTHFGIGENLRTCFSGPDVANTYKDGGEAPQRKCRNGMGKRGAIGVFQLL